MQGKRHIIQKEHELMINQINPIKHVHDAQENSIESLAVHPKQDAFATGSHDHTIKLWDVQKFTTTNTLKQHKDGVWSLDYSKDGALLASAGPDKSVLLWESKKSSPAIKINAHKDKVYCAKFNQTGKLLGTCGQQGQIFIWDVYKTKQPLAKLTTPHLVAYDFQWSGNQNYFFVSTLGSQLLAFDSKTFKQVSQDYVTKDIEDSKCQTIATNFKQIPNRAYVGSSRGVIAWYEMLNGKLIKQTQWVSHMDSVRTINIHPSKKVLMTTGRDGSAKIWNASEDNVQPTILGNLVLHNENIPGAAFLGEDMALTGSWDQKLALWKIKDMINL